MTQDEIRAHLQRDASVFVQIANAEDGSPQIAWGDTFFYVRDQTGEPRKMPFATIVTKDYTGFDSDSDLNRGGLYRLNIEVGKQAFEALFGFEPKALDSHRERFDFTAIDQLFPHPLYGASGWVSIINPEGESTAKVAALLDASLERALRRASARAG
jgi:hypothetical protein